MVQINGKILIANNSRIVGVTKSQAMARSDSPLICLATGMGVATAAEVAIFCSMEERNIRLRLNKTGHRNSTINNNEFL
jgi:hypothetical protein